MAEKKEADIEKNEYTTRELIDQMEEIKTAPFGYSKEEVYSFVQVLVRTMENERKRENAELFQQIQRLQAEKQILRNKRDDAESRYRESSGELEKLRAEKDEIQKRLDSFMESLKGISENAIARDQELADFHRRQTEMEEREKELSLLEEKQRQVIEKVKEATLSEMEVQKNEILAKTQNERNEILRRAQNEKYEILNEAQREAESLQEKSMLVKRELRKLEELLKPVFKLEENK